MINQQSKQKADHFLNHEKQFHLGFLPTEQSHPVTRGLDEITRKKTSNGIELLQRVDREVLSSVKKIFASNEFQALINSMAESLFSGKKIVFSGCGATGRLSILLEAAWRKFWQKLKQENTGVHDLENKVFSIMTGGDYALVRSVESFEDYMEFGRRQVVELGINQGDTFVAITEGGETSSVIGTAFQAIDDGAGVFVAFNNPAGLLRDHIERSRAIIDHPKTTVLDLHCGPMAVAGSTRMQAVTSELLVIGAALETALFTVLKNLKVSLSTPGYGDPVSVFESLLAELESPASVKALSEIIEFEEKIYSEKGLVTYYTDHLLLDIFTDTTERAPTFMLPPFVKCDDTESPQSWAFVKNPMFSSPETWNRVLARNPRCLPWTSEDYRSMGASKKIVENPPSITTREILKFRIGNEPAPERHTAAPSAAVAVISVSDFKSGIENFMKKFDTLKKEYSKNKILSIGINCDGTSRVPTVGASWSVPCNIIKSPLMLWEHLAVKLIMNTVSTLTMVRMGRIKSNWMSWAEATNKKLIDRGTRLISELCGLPYSEACVELFISLEQIESREWGTQAKPSPVQHAMNRINKNANA